MPEAQSIAELQNAIVLEILDTLNESWRDEPAEDFERIVVDIEHSLVNPHTAMQYMSFAVVRANNSGFETRNLRLDQSVRILISQLLKAIEEKESHPFGTCHIIIESDGKYKFWYDYRQPLTILPPEEGIIEGKEEHTNFFKNYHELYTEERRKRDAGENVDYIVNPIFNRP